MIRVIDQILTIAINFYSCHIDVTRSIENYHIICKFSFETWTFHSKANIVSCISKILKCIYIFMSLLSRISSIIILLYIITFLRYTFYNAF